MSVLTKQKLASILKNVTLIDTILGTFYIGKQHYEGGTAIVKDAIFENTSEKFAIKFLAENTNEQPSSQYLRFKQAYVNLFTKYYKLDIVPQLYFGELLIDNIKIPYTIMPYIDQTLKQYKQNIEIISFETFEKIFKILINSIGKIHENSIIHRDLKPENIFIYNKKLLIGDFDISKFNDPDDIKLVKTEKDDRLANYYFSAPEQSQKAIGEISYASDWFAFGQILYWLITGITIKGQNPNKISEKNINFAKYEALINKLTIQNPKKRLQSKEEIIKFIEQNDATYKEYQKQQLIIDSNIKFNNILCEIFPGARNLFQVTDTTIIEKLFNKFNRNIREIMAFGIFGSGGDADIERFIKTQTDIDGSFYIISHYEFKIKNLYCYKNSLDGFSFLLIEVDPMQTNNKLGQIYSDSNTVEGGFDNGHYISREEYDDGYSEFGKNSDECELRVRFVGPELIIISPKLCSMYNAQKDGIIRDLYQKYQNNNFNLKEEFLKPLMPPNIKRNIHTSRIIIEF